MSDLDVYVHLHLHEGDDAPTIGQTSNARRYVLRAENVRLFLDREQLDQLGASIVAALHANDDPMPANVASRIRSQIVLEGLNREARASGGQIDEAARS